MRSKDITGIRGVAAIEFVIVLPVLLTLFFGMINLTEYIAMNRRIATAAELVADLVTRHRDTIAAATVDDYFTAVELSIRPVDVANVRVDLYDYWTNGNTVVPRWTRSSSNGAACSTPKADDSDLVSLTQNGDDVVVAVVCTPFTPPSDFPGLQMFQGLWIERRVILKPRQSTVLNLT